MTYSTSDLPARASAGGEAAPASREGSYEVKFLLADPLVEPVIDWARARLAPDPHAEQAGDDTYRIHSLYFDTDAFDVFHRSPGFADTKYRLRRYGSEPLVYVEQKTKVRGWVTKRRSAVTDSELSLLQSVEPSPWSGGWFRQRIEEGRLAPRCAVAYRRLARVGEAEGAPVRLTLDRELRCMAAGSPELPPLDDAGACELPGTILELKFRDGMPGLFKELVREFRLVPTGSSKYRRAAILCGLAGPGKG